MQKRVDCHFQSWSVFGEQVSFWLEKPGHLCRSGKQKERKSCSTEAGKKGAASQVEQRMRDEECYSDAEEKAKEREEEARGWWLQKTG